MGLNSASRVILEEVIDWRCLNRILTTPQSAENESRGTYTDHCATYGPSFVERMILKARTILLSHPVLIAKQSQHLVQL